MNVIRINQCVKILIFCMMNILFYNISKTKAISLLSKHIHSNTSFFSNGHNTHDLIKHIDVNDDNIIQIIKNYNINILITNIITFDIDKVDCKIVSLSKSVEHYNKNSKIYHINDIQKLKDSSQPTSILPTPTLPTPTSTLPTTTPTLSTLTPTLPTPISKNINTSSPSHNILPPHTIQHIAQYQQHKQPTDNKTIYRNICSSYLKYFRQISIPRTIRRNLLKEAILVEFRILPHLELLLRNTIFHLGSDWSYTIVCGNDNYEFVTSFCKTVHDNIHVIKLDKNNVTQNDYNNLLLSYEFWNLFKGEKLLLYQEDTCMFNKRIDKFLQYDYVGAPFGIECVSPVNVGNGGFSIRTKSIMKAILERHPPNLFTSNCEFPTNYKNRQRLTHYPEDVYFSQSIQTHGIGTIAPYDESLLFSSEQVFTNNAVGMHCLWFSNTNWKSYITNYFSRILLESNINFPKFNVYILHCNEFHDRQQLIDNTIDNLSQHCNVNVHVFNSINTTGISLDFESQMTILNQHDRNIKFHNKDEFMFYKPGQIGCYLGHHLAVKQIMQSNKSGYSIILEDDTIINTDFVDAVMQIIDTFETSNEAFDVIYLGFLNNNFGTQKNGNIYNLNKDKWIFGAHGLLINNKSAHKLYRHNCSIRHEIDNHYKLLINDNLITGYYINPPLLTQNRKMPSYIGFHT
jgi:GR25 family glycosyltransferase involved in LPS biosynthesis